MTGQLQPLANNFPIVDQRGMPTDYFIRWAQAKQMDLQGAITASEALAIATDYVAEFMAAHLLQEGSGISITPSGNLSDSPTIAAEVQAILDQISAVQGTVLFRGAADWEALAPGAAGQFLKTNGAGADPAWATPAGGGGGGLTVISDTVLLSNAPSIDITGIPATYKDLVIAWNGAGTTEDIIVVRFNNDSGANYDFDRSSRAGSTVVVATANPQIGLCNAAPANVASSFEATVNDYAGTTFQKAGVSKIAFKNDITTAGIYEQHVGFFWRNTAAIDRVTAIVGSGNFLAGTRMTIYGRG